MPLQHGDLRALAIRIDDSLNRAQSLIKVSECDGEVGSGHNDPLYVDALLGLISSTKVDGPGGVNVESEQVAKLVLATDDEDPRAALEAAIELRSAASRLEAAVVRRARLAGWSWAQIAVALGVSKQAVHRKYGRS